MHFSLLHAPPSFPRDAFRHAGGGDDAADRGPSSPQTFCLLCSCREPRRGRTPFPAEPGLALCAGGCDLCGQGALGGGRELGRWWQWQAAGVLPEVLPQGCWPPSSTNTQPFLTPCSPYSTVGSRRALPHCFPTGERGANIFHCCRLAGSRAASYLWDRGGRRNARSPPHRPSRSLPAAELELEKFGRLYLAKGRINLANPSMAFGQRAGERLLQTPPAARPGG